MWVSVPQSWKQTDALSRDFAMYRCTSLYLFGKSVELNEIEPNVTDWRLSLMCVEIKSCDCFKCKMWKGEAESGEEDDGGNRFTLGYFPKIRCRFARAQCVSAERWGFTFHTPECNKSNAVDLWPLTPPIPPPPCRKTVEPSVCSLGFYFILNFI